MNTSEKKLTEIKEEIIKRAMDNSEEIIESWKINLGKSPFELTRKNLSRELNNINPEDLINTINRYENSLKIEKGGGRRGQKGGLKWREWLLLLLAASKSSSATPGEGNPFNGVNFGRNADPTFVDVDNDGDMDAFVGINDAPENSLLYFKNTGRVYWEAHRQNSLFKKYRQFHESQI